MFDVRVLGDVPRPQAAVAKAAARLAFPSRRGSLERVTLDLDDDVHAPAVAPADSPADAPADADAPFPLEEICGQMLEEGGFVAESDPYELTVGEAVAGPAAGGEAVAAAALPLEVDDLAVGEAVAGPAAGGEAVVAAALPLEVDDFPFTHIRAKPMQPMRGGEPLRPHTCRRIPYRLNRRDFEEAITFGEVEELEADHPLVLARRLAEVEEAPAEQNEAAVVAPNAAVSYTHLTLPTICSV